MHITYELANTSTFKFTPKKKNPCMYVQILLLVTQSCLTLCDPMDCSPSGSSVHGILQARILEWVAIPFSRGCSWYWDWAWVSCTAGRFFTVWATHQIICTNKLFPTQWLNWGLMSPALAGRFFTTDQPGKPLYNVYYILFCNWLFSFNLIRSSCIAIYNSSSSNFTTV